MPPKPRIKIPVHVFVYTIAFIPGAGYGKIIICVKVVTHLKLCLVWECCTSYAALVTEFAALSLAVCSYRIDRYLTIFYTNYPVTSYHIIL